MWSFQLVAIDVFPPILEHRPPALGHKPDEAAIHDVHLPSGFVRGFQRQTMPVDEPVHSVVAPHADDDEMLVRLSAQAVVAEVMDPKLDHVATPTAAEALWVPLFALRLASLPVL
jgi:hypothetical protein